MVAASSSSYPAKMRMLLSAPHVINFLHTSKYSQADNKQRKAAINTLQWNHSRYQRGPRCGRCVGLDEDPSCWRQCKSGSTVRVPYIRHNPKKWRIWWFFWSNFSHVRLAFWANGTLDKLIDHIKLRTCIILARFLSGPSRLVQYQGQIPDCRSPPHAKPLPPKMSRTIEDVQQEADHVTGEVLQTQGSYHYGRLTSF